MQNPFPETLQSAIETSLGEPISDISLLGRGCCNNAYRIQTSAPARYIFKEKQTDAVLTEQNSLSIEAGLIQELAKLPVPIPVPKVVFVSHDPEIYGYEYIEGEQMRDAWPKLSEAKRIEICEKLGEFHAFIGQHISKAKARILGLIIDESTDLHPETCLEYDDILASKNTPERIKTLAREARRILDETEDACVFQFIHYDAHHENILIKEERISGIIDFGDAEYGEMAKEFSRYIRDFPDYFMHIVSSYEKHSGHRLNRDRLVCFSFLSGLTDRLEEIQMGGDSEKKALESIGFYEEWISNSAQ